MIIALSGRRIDETETNAPRFPPANVPLVKERLKTLFEERKATAIVCSAACGTDLVALDVAGKLGLRRRMVLPFEPEKFRETSVTDRPGKWGEMFDSIYQTLQASGDVIVIKSGTESDEAYPDEAYLKVNERILEEAVSLAGKTDGAPSKEVLAVIVWEGAARQDNDITAKFAAGGKQRGIEVVEILTTYPDVMKVIRREILPPAQEMLLHAKKLKDEKAFNYARRILARAAEHPNLEENKKLKIYQQWALCTYKDTDLPADARLDKALDILLELEPGKNFNETKNQETLGLIGAIYKRKWEVDNQKQQLERSLLYYERGYREGPEGDQGYTGINAAFILDLLAHQEAEEAGKAKMDSPTAENRRSEARSIRKNIVKKVLRLLNKPETSWLAGEWWFYSTIAEAYFGLGKHDKNPDKNYHRAVKWLKRGEQAIGNVPEWELESTITQLARLAIIQTDSSRSGNELRNTPPWKALEDAFGPIPTRTAFMGKIGLALSGGGFRASLFHIGTLAKLAELGVLQHVEVLSCVSGGSIIGAHYYLEVRELLRATPEDDITSEDYVKIVERIQDDFLKGVQRNIRVRVAREFTTNLKMFFHPNYTRTMRSGELYEEEIFSKVQDGQGEKERYLDQLNIVPAGESEGFSPKLHNWHRKIKVPVLMLNATTLNTGHNWQFTTNWMGEPPSSIAAEIDTNDQLRRMYYQQAPRDHRKVRLGHAVAASASVPGLFDPLSFEGLYPERIVRLVDGGVCDNQGISSLLEQDCTVILVSDGSGQMETENIPSDGLLGVPLRSNSILQARIRDAQYHDLERRRRSSLLRELMFIHLKENLYPDPVNWIDCPDPFDKLDDISLKNCGNRARQYKIDGEIQKRLAAIRTDLDSFSDIEAYALMSNAYRLTEDAFKNFTWAEGLQKKGVSGNWKFLEVERGMTGPGKQFQYMMDLLATSNSIAFKIWKQVPWLKYTSWFLGAALIGLVIWLFFRFSEYSITLGTVGKWVGMTIVILLLPYLYKIVLRWRKVKELDVHRDQTVKRVTQAVRWQSTLYKTLFEIAACILGAGLARLHLRVFDKMFLNRGSINSFRK